MEEKIMAFTHEGSVTVKGRQVSYRLAAKEFPIYGKAGEKEASLFSWSYLRTDVSEEERGKRPVLFCFNGGPGASSIWIHMGFLGPLRMKYADAVNPPVLPPYEMQENDLWLLDVCDIVLIDPAMTGYSRLYDSEKAPYYYSVNGDAKSVADLIEAWLREHGRWGSPIYLLGESYGTMRAPLVAEELMGGPMTLTARMRGIAAAGIVFMGTVKDFDVTKTGGEDATELYAMAATNWYFNGGDRPLSAALEEGWSLVEEYKRTKPVWHGLAPTKKKAFARRLSAATGIGGRVWEQKLEEGQPLTLREYAVLLREKEGEDVGIYDGRYTMKKTDVSPSTLDVVSDDPAMGRYTPSFIGAFNGVYLQQMGIDTQEEYKAISFGEVNEAWNYDFALGRTPLDCLKLAARRNPGFRILLTAGLFDLCTPPGFVREFAAGRAFPAERITYREYESGHMPYLGDDSLEKLTEDIREFLLA